MNAIDIFYLKIYVAFVSEHPTISMGQLRSLIYPFEIFISVVKL